MIYTKKKSFLFFLLTVLIILSTSSVYAQADFSPDQFKVDKVNGQVVTNDENPYPFSSSKVELFNINDNKNLVGSTITDKDGLFEIESVEKGEFRLVVWATTKQGHTFFTYDIILQMVKNKKNQEAKKMLYIKY